MGRCYYCHRNLAGRRIHYVVTPAGNLAPVCADDRECKPKGIPCKVSHAMDISPGFDARHGRGF